MGGRSALKREAGGCGFRLVHLSEQAAQAGAGQALLAPQLMDVMASMTPIPLPLPAFTSLSCHGMLMCVTEQATKRRQPAAAAGSCIRPSSLHRERTCRLVCAHACDRAHKQQREGTERGRTQRHFSVSTGRVLSERQSAGATQQALSTPDGAQRG